ncbi:MAG: universal stress protein, partial [Nitrospirota bacterium]|nr:universal stress protein [Nitrospirota bacterium]
VRLRRPINLKTILIPVDGSPQSDEAVRSLQAFSPPNRIVLLHCFSIPQLAYPGTGMSVGREFSEAAEQELRKEGSRILKRAASQLPAVCGETSQHLEVGDTASVILSMAQKESADLILIGSRGLGVIKEHVLGSVSHRVAIHAPCPTLIVKSSLMPLKNILLPIEHPLDAEWAIEWLAEKPFQSLPHLSMLHVIPFVQPVLPIGALLPDAWKKELQTGSAHFTQDVTNTLTKLGYQADRFVEPGVPSSIIQEHIARLQPQLVLMSTYNRPPLNRLAHGSVSHATVHHAPCSVLLLKGRSDVPIT